MESLASSISRRAPPGRPPQVPPLSISTMHQPAPALPPSKSSRGVFARSLFSSKAPLPPQGEASLEDLTSELKRECVARAETRGHLRNGAEDSSQSLPGVQPGKPAGEPSAASSEAGPVGSKTWLNEWKRSPALKARSRYCSFRQCMPEAHRRAKILLTEGRKPLLLFCLGKVVLLTICMTGSHVLQHFSFGDAVLIANYRLRDVIVLACAVVLVGALNGGLLLTLLAFRKKDIAKQAESKQSRRPGRPPGVAPKGKAKPKPKSKAAAVKPKEESHVPNFSPSVKVRQVFWSSIRLKDDTKEQPETFWSQVRKEFIKDKDSYNIDRGSIEDAFKDREPIPIVASTSQKLPQSQRKVKVLSDSRRKQICVMFPTLPKPEELQLALLNMNQPPADKLDKDQVERLLLNMPSSAEAAELLQTDDEADLDPAENFLKALLHDIKHLKLRLQVMHFENSLHDQMEVIVGSQTALSASINFLKSSRGIRNLLTEALMTGNYLNSGTARGKADGFAIETLTHLKDVKMNDSLGTLINYITDQMEKKNPGELTEIFSLDQAGIAQVDCIKQASRCNSEEVIGQMTSLMKQTEHLLELLKKQCTGSVDIVPENEVHAAGEELGSAAMQLQSSEESVSAMQLQSSDDSYEERRRFLPHRDKFIRYIEELKKLSERVQDAHSNFKMLCEWFVVDQSAGTRTSDWFFDIWDRFLNDVRKALKEREAREKVKSAVQFRRESGSGQSTPRDIVSKGRMATPRSQFRHSWPTKKRFEAGGATTPRTPRRDSSAGISRFREYNDMYKRRNSIGGGITPRMLENVNDHFRRSQTTVTTPLSGAL